MNNELTDGGPNLGTLSLELAIGRSILGVVTPVGAPLPRITRSIETDAVDLGYKPRKA